MIVCILIPYYWDVRGWGVLHQSLLSFKGTFQYVHVCAQRSCGACQTLLKHCLKNQYRNGNWKGRDLPTTLLKNWLCLAFDS